MNFKNSNPFRYKVTSAGVNFSLQTSDNEEVAESRDLEDIASAIFEDSEIMIAYEEGRIDFSEIETCVKEINEIITSLRFADNFQESEEY